MKQYRIHIPLTAALILVAMGIATIATRSIRGQSPATAQKTESLVKPTVMVPNAGASRPAAPPFTEAAAQNVLLRTDLAWTFGSKQQHG